MKTPLQPARAVELVRTLGLQPHPEGGHYHELFRSGERAQPADARGSRSALTCIDFLLVAGEFSAWHRVASDEAWHLLEGGPLVLWLMPPALDRIERVELAPVDATRTPRHVVPAHWWQAAEPMAEFAYCSATVGPGFEFADFSFLRDDRTAFDALALLRADLERLR